MHCGTFFKSKICKNIENSRQKKERLGYKGFNWAGKKSSQFVKIFRKYSDSLLDVTPTAACSLKWPKYTTYIFFAPHYFKMDYGAMV